MTNYKQCSDHNCPRLLKLDHTNCKKVICKECGREFHSLKSHFRKHNLTAREYQRKWGVRISEIQCSVLRDFQIEYAKKLVRSKKIGTKYRATKIHVPITIKKFRNTLTLLRPYRRV